MSRSFRALLCAAGMIAATTISTVVVTAPAEAATQLCEKYGWTYVSAERFVVANQIWGADTPQCTEARDDGFTVVSEAHSNPPTGQPAAYPSIFAGCHWARCTQGSGLPLAADDPRFATIRTGVDVTVPADVGIYNTSFDVWFDPTPRTDGQQTGAELMVWLDHRGPVQPVGVPVATVALAGATWQVWFGKSGWNVISYVRTAGTASADFTLADFYTDAVRRGYADAAWYLTNVQVGFEVWSHAAGLSVDQFRYHIDDVDVSPSVTPPTGPPASCAVAYQQNSQWAGGYQADMVISNLGPTAWSDWQLTFDYPVGQRIHQAWGAEYQPGSETVTLHNARWNGRVPGGTSVRVGVLGSWSGSNPAPTRFAVNGSPCDTVDQPPA